MKRNKVIFNKNHNPSFFIISIQSIYIRITTRKKLRCKEYTINFSFTYKISTLPPIKNDSNSNFCLIKLLLMWPIITLLRYDVKVTYYYYLILRWPIITILAAICRRDLPWEFAARICRGYLSQEFAVASCRRNLLWLFAVGIWRLYL